MTYEPTQYDKKLEELISRLGESIVSRHELCDDARALIEQQKHLHMARSPEYVRYLEEQRGLV